MTGLDGLPKTHLTSDNGDLAASTIWTILLTIWLPVGALPGRHF